MWLVNISYVQPLLLYPGYYNYCNKSHIDTLQKVYKSSTKYQFLEQMIFKLKITIKHKGWHLQND